MSVPTKYCCLLTRAIPRLQLQNVPRMMVTSGFLHRLHADLENCGLCRVNFPVGYDAYSGPRGQLDIHVVHDWKPIKGGKALPDNVAVLMNKYGGIAYLIDLGRYHGDTVTSSAPSTIQDFFVWGIDLDDGREFWKERLTAADWNF